jgi:hypothetical protein
VNNIKSGRFLGFILILTVFWMFVPLFIITRLMGPTGPIGFLVALGFVWFAAPKVNSWLIVNNPAFRRLWEWAREGEGD